MHVPSDVFKTTAKLVLVAKVLLQLKNQTPNLICKHSLHIYIRSLRDRIHIMRIALCGIIFKNCLFTL